MRVLVGQLWPGAVHWPDFKNPATLDWWFKQIQGVNDTLPVDGIWLDMNEVWFDQLCPCCTAFDPVSKGTCEDAFILMEKD